MTFKRLNSAPTSDLPSQSFIQIRFFLIVESLIKAKLVFQEIDLRKKMQRKSEKLKDEHP